MPAKFVRLRIAGFKSFAEPATVEILPGLTGVVGPNGCGKSNVIEALRWAMGESSARSLRGGEMDDVIFAGTAARPSRNLAEVVLHLEDAAGLAPTPFHEQAELQVSRRIERGVGSTYRVNGREVRARDVQTLFADLASGARSSAMVSQGRVGAIVNARPDERRAVLEEAAGITGLHARRHEAEGKLRAAEANLARAEDLRGQLDTQLTGLKRQARQAARYRNLSGLVREAEAELLALQQARAESQRDAARQALHAAEAAVAAATIAATAASAEATDAAAALPALREAEGAARTVLERARIARESVAAEAARARDALAAAVQRRDQVGRDFSHAQQVSRDADAAESRLSAEAERLADEAEAFPTRLAATRDEAAAAAEEVRRLDGEATRATEQAAALQVRAQGVTEALRRAETVARRLADQLGRLRPDRDRAAAQIVSPARLEEAVTAQAEADAALAASRAGLEQAERARTVAQAGSLQARDRQSRAEAARAKLAAESGALAEVLGVKDRERWPPMVDLLQVPAGLEAALGAVLGEELAAAADPAAPRHWRDLPPRDAVTPPGTPLSELVTAPPALARALSATALVETETEGDAAQPGLLPGQVLVSRGGAVWRWDGYTMRAGTPTAAAIRLQQRNRLAGLRSRLAETEAEAAESRAARTAADIADRSASAAEQAARAARRDAEARLERTRAQAVALRAQATEATARLAGLNEQLARLEPDAAEADAALAAARADAAGLPELAMLRGAVDRSRAALAAARTREAAATRAADALTREGAARDARRRAVAAEREDWRLRADHAADRVTDLAARAAEAEQHHALLAAEPDRVAARNAEALDALEGAETAHRRASTALAAATDRGTAADRAARRGDADLVTAREAVLRAEGAKAQADHAWGTVAERVIERLGNAPALPASPADTSPEAEDKARRKLERLAREREEMGPVNLRAELEAGEIENALAAIERERGELGTAIAKLRGSIGHLNREGRERLAQVFEQVDRHFQALFTRMFGGGRAHLALVGSDDPLQAGLEIYAQPPGKKLATLSLLSGGEQALTALSLVFAVFRCNPAPVCVLDEVDAPLDDANVERFCTLLADMVAETGTRFLVVTHHHLTMARMDRLYGVTMQERGISRLLSVDLQRASEMVEDRVAAE